MTVTVEEMKSYLRVDFEDDDSLIANFITAAKKQCMDILRTDDEADLDAGYFVRWVAADLVLAGNNTEKSVDNFTLWADGYAETTYKLVIVEPEDDSEE